MSDHGLDDAQWIARPVSRSQRIIRQIVATRVDWAEPGHSLAQTFRSDGPIAAINVDLTGPRDADPFAADVKFTVGLEDASGDVVAERLWEGPQLVWDYFGLFLDVTPPAPPGLYRVVLRSERQTIGWSTADAAPVVEDDGLSPIPVNGQALSDDQPVAGVRLLGVETLPAPNPDFRRLLELPAAPKSAMLTATVLGTGVIRVNGTRVGDEMLEPAVTDYDKTVLYRSWDIRHLLRAGKNEITISAGRERYSARGADTWGWSLAPWHREPMALARLDMLTADGSSGVVVTDERWESAPGAVEAERLFRGEDWVLRAADPEWSPVVVATPPAGELRRADLPPVRALSVRTPRAVEPLSRDRTVYDFGDVMVGRIRCRVSGGVGAFVRVVAGEQRAAGGQVICDNFLVAGEAQVDTIRFDRSASDVIWEPQFGYRGFRWMQVETFGGAVVEEVRAVPLYSDIETVGDFTTDEPVIEWIDSATARTFRNNLHGIPTDTPIYEKNGWTADAHLATEALLHHYDLRTAFGKWMQDHVDAQTDDGAVPQIIPTPGWGRAADPTWSSSAVLIPWYLYREYGERAILEQAAPMARRFADHVVSLLDDGIWRGRTWGDWLSPGHLTGPEGMAPIGTIMTVSALHHTAAILRELGEDASAYESEADAVGRAYHDEWFDPATGGYRVPQAGYRQVLDILPLAFGTVPPAHIESVRAALTADIEGRSHGHIDCGAVGVRHLLPVLTEAGRDDLAVTVLTRRTRPGWGAWFGDGETTLLESWDVDARSRNHYFLGSVDAWIQQRVGGLTLTEPGWRSFDISPLVDDRVTRAGIRHRTPLGDAAVKWERGAGGWRFEVTVPEGSAASVRVPGSVEELTPGRHVVHLPLESPPRARS